jgi:SPP1 family predicted phage head-tail adaptor
MPVKVGQMNRKVTIQRKTLVADTAGQPQEVWQTLRSAWAAIESLQSREIFSAQQAGIVATLRITTWYMRDVEANAGTWRLLFAPDRIVNIITAMRVDPGGASPPQLEMLCGEALPSPNQS